MTDHEPYATRLTNIERRTRRLPNSDDYLMKAVAVSLLAEIRTLHRLVQDMALAIPRDQMDEAEARMLDAILENDQ